MYQKVLFASLPWIGLTAVTLGAAGARAGDCSIDTTRLDRGERRPALICGAGIPAAYTISAPAASGLVIDYQQHLTRCDVDRAEPGLYLRLRATADAATM